MGNKLSELKYALECLEGAQYDGEWNSALVGGGGDGAEYPAVTNPVGLVVRTARLGPHEARLCEYLKAVSPSNIRTLLAELESAERQSHERYVRIAELESKLVNAAHCITGLERHVKDIEATLIAATDEVSDLEKERDEARANLATPVRLPNESAASAMFDIFYQTERNNYGNVQLGFSDAKALGEWITKTLELRGAGFKCVGDA